MVCGAGLLTGRLKTGSIGRRGGECVSDGERRRTRGAEIAARRGGDRGGASEKGGRAVVLI